MIIIWPFDAAVSRFSPFPRFLLLYLTTIFKTNFSFSIFHLFFVSLFTFSFHFFNFTYFGIFLKNILKKLLIEKYK